MPSFDQKMREVLGACSFQAQRFGLLVLTLSASSHRPDDPEEFLRMVLDMTSSELDLARDEFNERTQDWNEAHAVPRSPVSGVLEGVRDKASS